MNWAKHFRNHIWLFRLMGLATLMVAAIWGVPFGIIAGVTSLSLVPSWAAIIIGLIAAAVGIVCFWKWGKDIKAYLRNLFFPRNPWSGLFMIIIMGSIIFGAPFGLVGLISLWWLPWWGAILVGLIGAIMGSIAVFGWIFWRMGPNSSPKTA